MKKFNFKNIRNISLASICALMITSACNKDFFDSQPDNLLGIETIFSNRVQTENYWGGLFSEIPDIWNQPYSFNFSAITDEADVSNWADGTIETINNGATTSDNSPQLFVTLYTKIRQCAVFLENVDKCKELLTVEGGAERVKQYKAEAKFLRAFYYWRMMKMYGPIVIQPLQSTKASDEFQIPRSTWDECVEFVLAQLAEAKVDLPAEYYQTGTTTPNVSETGRINKMIVSALESEVLLYHASPLFNGNTELANFKNFDGKILINQTYDASRWAKAAQSAKATIDLAEANGKSLFKVNDANAFKSAFLSVRNLYWDGWKTEGIWIRPSSNRSQWESHAAPRAIAGTAYNGIATFQEVVDDFRTDDGSSIKQSVNYTESGFTSTATDYYVQKTSNMYVGREPRFYAFVTFNGSVIPGAPKSGMTNVEFFNTGNSGRSGSPRDWPKTGYTARKNIHPTFSWNPGVAVARPAMLFRLAEIYLMYAEALNESDPTNPDVLKYLNEVRMRGGLPALSAGLSQAQIREEIHLERRIELIFEGKRFFDVRRWKKVDIDGYRQGGIYKGMDMTKGSKLDDPEFHTRVNAVTRRPWATKYYFFPYPQNEIDRNKQLVQFPGY
jgi:starch-binding outer membrane protein, SusD/RagB family